MTSPRRGRPPILDRETIVDGALRLLEREGVEALTMKGLAKELGMSPMAPYRYVEGKQALLTLVLERVLDAGDVPAHGPWRERLWALMWGSFERIDRYPGLADHLWHSTITEPGRRLVRAGVALLLESGMTPAEARLAYSDVYAYMMGRLVLRSRAFESRDHAGHRHAPGPVPSLAELGSDEHVRHGYEALVLGLSAPGGGAQAG